jgi:hypothetical protein
VTYVQCAILLPYDILLPKIPEIPYSAYLPNQPKQQNQQKLSLGATSLIPDLI